MNRSISSLKTNVGGSSSLLLYTRDFQTMFWIARAPLGGKEVVSETKNLKKWDVSLSTSSIGCYSLCVGHSDWPRGRLGNLAHAWGSTTASADRKTDKLPQCKIASSLSPKCLWKTCATHDLSGNSSIRDYYHKYNNFLGQLVYMRKVKRDSSSMKLLHRYEL